MITKIENVRIADGLGGDPRWGEVYFNDHILESCSVVDKVIDGKGLLLTPGFIDVHGHSDISAIARNECFSKISQGFTTEICGNCGLSPFPLTPLNRPHLQELYANYNQELTWSSCSQYIESLKSHRVKLNLKPLCGHNTLRAAVLGYNNISLTFAKLQEMCDLLDRELRAGALGLSSGLLYTPGCFASSEEIIALLKVVAKHNKIYTTHLRSEGDELLESIAETIAVVQMAGLKKLHISHLKTAKSQNWHKLDQVFKLIKEGEKDGLTITFDRYPYTEALTQLSVIAEGRFSNLDDSSLMKVLADKNAQKEFEKLLNRDWTKVILASTTLKEYEQFLGLNFAAIATNLNRTASNIVTEILSRDACSCMAAFSGMNYDNMVRIVCNSACLCGSDESARPLDYSIGRSHPRGFGSLVRYWQVLAESGLSVGKIVRRLTSIPATRFGLNEIGTIAIGQRADLVLLDEYKLSSQASFAMPHTPTCGIEMVWINGDLVFL